MYETTTERLYGFVPAEEFAGSALPIRALLFGQMVKRTIPVTQEYLSDLYHDALWLAENVHGEIEFEFLARPSGTNIGMPDSPMNSARIGVQIGPGETAVFYRIRLYVDRRMWHAEFTQIPLDEVPKVVAA